MVSLFRLFFPIIVLHSLVAAQKPLKLWPMGPQGKVVNVPYEIGKRFRPHQVIQEGLNDISKLTCIRFLERTHQKDYVHFRYSENIGHSEGIGVIGGRQEIVLSPFGSINKERTIHEMLHTLGFHHMHQRFDRDEHVKIFFENIREKNKFAFKKHDNRHEAQGTPYDYDSILHYPKDTFSKNTKNTIVPWNLSYLDTIGHKLTLSEGDALRINRMYNCPKFETWGGK